MIIIAISYGSELACRDPFTAVIKTNDNEVKNFEAALALFEKAYEQLDKYDIDEFIAFDQDQKLVIHYSLLDGLVLDKALSVAHPMTGRSMIGG